MDAFNCYCIVAAKICLVGKESLTACGDQLEEMWLMIRQGKYLRSQVGGDLHSSQCKILTMILYWGYLNRIGFTFLQAAPSTNTSTKVDFPTGDFLSVLSTSLNIPRFLLRAASHHISSTNPCP